MDSLTWRVYGFALLLQITTAWSRTVSVVIDDTLGDEKTGAIPVYTPRSWWDRRSDEKFCSRDSCNVDFADIDSSGLRNRTWHAGIRYPEDGPMDMSFSFSGSSLRIFVVLANGVGGPSMEDRYTHLEFYLDGDPTRDNEFFHQPTTDSPEFLYNQVVYNNNAIPNGNHRMLIRTISDSRRSSLVLFDYAEYELDIPDPTDIVPQALTGGTTSSKSSGVTTTMVSSPTFESSVSPTHHMPSPLLSLKPTTHSVTVGPSISSSFGGPNSTSAISSEPSSSANAPSQQPDIKHGSIAGMVVVTSLSGLAVLLLALCLIWRFVRRRRLGQKKEKFPSTTVQPFVLPASAGSNAALLPEGNFQEELDRMREEIERLRQTVEIPPQYTQALKE